MAVWSQGHSSLRRLGLVPDTAGGSEETSQQSYPEVVWKLSCPEADVQWGSAFCDLSHEFRFSKSGTGFSHGENGTAMACASEMQAMPWVCVFCLSETFSADQAARHWVGILSPSDNSGAGLEGLRAPIPHAEVWI